MCGTTWFTCDYGSGDNWQHCNTGGKARVGPAAVDNPAYGGGARHCPPEDFGALTGYPDFLPWTLEPSQYQHKGPTEWCESLFLDLFDPDDIDAPPGSCSKDGPSTSSPYRQAVIVTQLYNFLSDPATLWRALQTERQGPPLQR